MATFAEIDEYLDDSITLPIRGKNYVIPSPDARTGLEVHRLMGLATDAVHGKDISEDQRVQLVLDDEQESELMVRLLGPAFEQMVADGVPWNQMQHAMQTVIVWVAQGLPVAAGYWATGGTMAGPKAPPTPQDHKPKTAQTRRAQPA